MGFYSEFVKTNPTGMHMFLANVINTFPQGYQVSITGQTPDGALVSIRKGGTIIATDILVHTNGRKPPPAIDYAKDTMVIDIGDIAPLPDDIQACLQADECLPGGVIGRPA